MPWVTQSLAVTLTAPGLTWRQDVSLPSPDLLFPVDGARYCPEIVKQLGGSAGIRLSWTSVIGASFYVVHLCADQSFQGSTLQGIRTVNTYVDLEYLNQVSVGQRFYWRVSAFTANGGSSVGSTPRYVVLECPSQSGEGYDMENGVATADPKKCDRLGVDLSIVGPDNVRLTESERAWVLNINYDCKTSDNYAVTIEDVLWTFKQSSSQPVTKISPDNSADPEDSLVLKCSVSTTDVQTFEIQCDVTFSVNGTTFICSERKRVLIEGEGSGGGAVYVVALSNVDCASGVADGTVVRGPCGSTTGAVVEVEDVLGCFLTGPQELLEGVLAITAPMGASAGTSYSGPCPHVIIGMCCQDFSC